MLTSKTPARTGPTKLFYGELPMLAPLSWTADEEFEPATWVVRCCGPGRAANTSLTWCDVHDVHAKGCQLNPQRIAVAPHCKFAGRVCCGLRHRQVGTA